MTDLQARAKDYARGVILRLRENILLCEDTIFDAIADAYEQGYIECDTEGERPETQDEYFNEAPGYENPGASCINYYEGYCTKGLFPPCVREGCGGYIPKSWFRPKDE